MNESPKGDEAAPSHPSPPLIPPRSWQKGIGPAFLSLGLSVVLLDRLAPTTLMVGGLGPALIGAIFAGLLAYWCLYYAPAMWGVRARQPLAVVASSTFGQRGIVVLPALLMIAVHVVWFAVTIEYAVQYGLSALSACGLLDPGHLVVQSRGSYLISGSLFLAIAASWSLASAVIGTLAVRLVSAIMYAYAIFPVLVIAAAAVWAIPTVTSGPIATVPFTLGGGRALVTMIQLVFAFLAAQSLTMVDWGAATETEKDVRNGGLSGLLLAIPILIVLSLLIVAGSLGRVAETHSPRSTLPTKGGMLRPDAEPAIKPGGAPIELGVKGPTLREAFRVGIGGRLGGAALFILALALLGPACTNPFEIARYTTTLWPRVPRWGAALAGAIATWPLMASGWTKDLEVVFGFLGAITASAVGAIAADFAKTRGRWPGPRPGVNLAGFGAWLIGIAAAFGTARWGELTIVTRYWPSSVVGFAAGFVGYLVLSAMRLEPKSLTKEAASDGSLSNSTHPT